MHSKESSTRVPTQITCKFLDSTAVAVGRRRGRNYRREPHSVNLCIQTLSHPPREPRGPSVREGAHYRGRKRSVNESSHVASDLSQVSDGQAFLVDRPQIRARFVPLRTPTAALPSGICACPPAEDTCRQRGCGPAHPLFQGFPGFPLPERRPDRSSGCLPKCSPPGPRP